MKKFKLIKVSVFATCRACVFDTDKLECGKHSCSHSYMWTKTRRLRFVEFLGNLIK